MQEKKNFLFAPRFDDGASEGVSFFSAADAGKMKKSTQ